MFGKAGSRPLGLSTSLEPNADASYPAELVRSRKLKLALAKQSPSALFTPSPFATFA